MILNEFDIKELAGWLRKSGESPFRARQIFKWLWQKGESDPFSFTDLPMVLREKLASEFEVGQLKVVEALRSEDGSIKFLMELPDGEKVESVFIPEADRKTVCVSSQVGCPLRCAFCATGLMGFRRNLKAWEIAGQVLEIRKYLGLERVTNVVFMGMGEPFLNTEETLRAVRILNEPWGPGIGARKITLSTVGIIPGIRKLVSFDRQVKLAISLHTAIQEKREKLVPIARQYPVSALKEVLVDYYERTRRRITIEYVHLPGVNDTDEDVEALSEFLDGMKAKINLIPFNPHPKLPFRPPTDDEVKAFLEKLYRLPHAVTLRKSKGRDVRGACGQLAIERIQ